MSFTEIEKYIQDLLFSIIINHIRLNSITQKNMQGVLIHKQKQ